MAWTSSAAQRNTNITNMISSITKLVYLDSGNTVLATFACNTPNATVDGATATMSFVASEVNGSASGNIAKAQYQNVSSVSVYETSDVSTSGGHDVVVSHINVVSGSPVSVTSATLTAPN